MMRRATPWRLLAGAALVLASWQILALALSERHLVAGPDSVADWLTVNSALVLRGLGVTLGNAAIGFLAGNLAAIALATTAMAWPRLRGLVTGLALVVFCLPLIATGPILRVLMGPGNGPQIVLAGLAVYYTTLIPVLTGLRAAPAVWLDLVRSYGRGAGDELIHIRIRAALPYLFAGLQIAAPAAFLGAMVGEFTGAERGLGMLTIRFMRDLDVPALWSVALVATAISLACYGAIGLLARLLLRDPPPVILAPPSIVTGAHGSWFLQIVLLVAATMMLWWAVMAAFQLNDFFAKRPLDVLDALLLVQDAAQTRATLARAMAETAIYLLPGYLAGLGLGAGLAILLALVPGLSALVMPLAVALRSIPIVTTAPLIVLVFGRGAVGTICLVALMVFFPTLIASLHGLKQAPGQILDVFDSYAAGRWRQMRDVHIPAMMPALFAAARMSVPAAVLAVTVVEWLTTGRGLGSLMALSASVSDYDMLWSAVLVITAISAACYGIVAMIERRVLSIFAPEQLK